MKNISNILLLVISLLFIVTGLILIPHSDAIQDLAFVIMALIIVGLFGIIKFNCYKQK